MPEHEKEKEEEEVQGSNSGGGGAPSQATSSSLPLPPSPPLQALGSDPDESDALHSVQFNQDGGCLSVGTARGFRVCNSYPYGETFRREFGGDGGDEGDGDGDVNVNGKGNGNADGDGGDAPPDDIPGEEVEETSAAGGRGGGGGGGGRGGGGGGGGGVGLAAMLYRTNLLALTSTTPPPAHAASRVTHSMHTAHHSLGGGGTGSGSGSGFGGLGGGGGGGGEGGGGGLGGGPSGRTAGPAAKAGGTAGSVPPLAQVTSPSFPANKVLIYDDALGRPIGELSFRHRVLAVRLRRDRIVVVLRDRIYVYRFSDLTLMDCVGTGRNEAGLCSVSLEGTAAAAAAAAAAGGGGGGATGSAGGGSGSDDDAVMVLACPGVVNGQVRLELYGLRKTALINAHQSPLAALSVSADGTVLATASERGTVIRLFETGLVRREQRLHIRGDPGGEDWGDGGGGGGGIPTGLPSREFRRGVERASVSCLAFSLDGEWLGCGSDRGTVHVFRCWDGKEDGGGGAWPTAEEAEAAKTKEEEKKKKKKKGGMIPRSPAKLLAKVLPTTKRYFMSEEGAVAHIRGIPHPLACAFVPDRDRTIAVAGTDELGNGCLLVAEFGVGREEGGGGGAAAAAAPSDGPADEAEISGSGRVRRLGYHRFFRRAPIAHHKSASRRRQQARQLGQGNSAPYDGLCVGSANPDGEVNVPTVARMLDDITFQDGADDGFDLVDVK